MAKKRVSFDERFWSKVAKGDAGECWEWTGSKVAGRQYGQIWNKEGRTQERAHRAAYRLTFGCIPDGLYVCHHCDNPSCVNPRHLFLGTQFDNMADAKAKHRIAAGDRNGTRTKPESVRRGAAHHRPVRKLTDEAVLTIRSEYQPGRVTLQSLARRYGITPSAVSKVVLGRTWRHLNTEGNANAQGRH